MAPLLLANALASPGAAASEVEQCLARTLYWEARGGGHEGMSAVGAVVLNRVEHEEFPSDLCGVVRQGGETPPCQFSYWCDGRSDEPAPGAQWELAKQVAHLLVGTRPPDPTDGALFFHSDRIERPWILERERTVSVGGNVYYR